MIPFIDKTFLSIEDQDEATRLQEHLNHLNSQKDLLEQQLSQVQDHLHDTHIRLALLRNKSIPVARLPVELLLAIFRIEHNSAIKEPEDPLFLLNALCQVSHQWRNLILKDSSFWTTIHAFPDTPLDQFHWHLQRSQGSPLNLYLNLTRWGEQPSALEALIRIVNEQLHRCHFLSLIYAHFTSSTILSGLKLRDAQSLRYLNLEQVDVKGGPVFAGRWIIGEDQKLPNLTSLRLFEDQMIEFDPPESIQKTLTTLHITHSGLFYRYQVIDFLAFLSSLSNLEHLLIDSGPIVNIATPGSVVLPALRTLTLGEDIKFDPILFLTALVSPRLESVTLLSLKECAIVQVSFKDLDFPFLWRMVLIEGRSISSHFRGAMPSLFPYITDFTLVRSEQDNTSEYTQGDYLLELLSTNAVSTDLPWPKLERLAIDPVISAVNMETIMEHRLSLGHPIKEWAVPPKFFKARAAMVGELGSIKEFKWDAQSAMQWPLM